MKQPCVYILASQPYGTLYIGVTSDLIARLDQHRSGQVNGFTSRYRVYCLARFEQFETMHDAISREKQLKRWHRQWKINLIESENPRDVLSDDTIVERLREAGVDIARRTVAKYREAMRIPSSVQRRRDKQAALGPAG